MSPSLADANSADGFVPNTENAGDVRTVESISLKEFFNCQDIELVEFFANPATLKCAPSFAVHVCDIVQLSAHKKMVWIHTRRIIAAMKNLKSPVGVGILHEVNKSVRQRLATLEGEHSITAVVECSIPNPASIFAHFTDVFVEFFSVNGPNVDKKFWMWDYFRSSLHKLIYVELLAVLGATNTPNRALTIPHRLRQSILKFAPEINCVWDKHITD